MRSAAEGLRRYLVARAPDLAFLPVPAWREGVTAIGFGARVRGLLAFLVILLLLGVGSRPVEAQEPCRAALEERQRYGFVALRADWSTAFAVDTLNAGWYVNPVQPTPPHEGMDQTVIIRTPSGYTVDPDTLGPLVDANPGATWLIGSEPDCIWQDDVLPEEYARIYHDLYVFIKGRDQMSQIAAGGIVQPTPLRLVYLDLVLAGYQARYGEPLPVDLWHIHNAILNEVRDSWGADIPPGIEANQGVLRSVDDNDNVAIFQNQIRAFRQWMVDRGYSDYPLIITEYGILMPVEYGFTAARVNQYMTATSDYLSTETDAVLGASWDGGRLVQRWAWFSLDEQPWDPLTGQGFNGNLFDPDTMLRTAHGDHFANLTASLQPLLHVDLGLGRWQVVPVPEVVPPAGTVDQSVRVRLVNAGTADSGTFQVRLSYAGPVSGSLMQPVTSLGPHAARWITFTLPGLLAGRYDLSLEIDAGQVVQESAECNNQASRGLVVPSMRRYLPLVLGGGVSAGQGRVPAASGPALTGGEPVSPHPALPSAVASLPVWFEYPLPQAGSYPGQLALDEARGVLWVTERDGDRIGRLELGTEPWAWEEFDLPQGSQPWGLAVDADGSVWFAESGASRIGKLEDSGAITHYDQGLTPGSQPWGVALDGEGLVWFTERAAGQIGLLYPTSGQVEEYTPPSSNALPGGIAVHACGRELEDLCVWFAETGTHFLGLRRITTTGIDWHEFQTANWQDPLIGPEDVTVVSSGNPWVSNTGGNSIALNSFSTLSGFSNIVDVPTPDSEPYGITVSASGDVWFTERAGDKVGRYGPQTFVVEYPLPTPGSQPTDIVVDGQGCAWVAAPGANQVLRLCFRAGDYFAYLPLVLR